MRDLRMMAFFVPCPIYGFDKVDMRTHQSRSQLDTQGGDP
jgi:hypothetical protein